MQFVLLVIGAVFLSIKAAPLQESPEKAIVEKARQHGLPVSDESFTRAQTHDAAKPAAIELTHDRFDNIATLTRRLQVTDERQRNLSVVSSSTQLPATSSTTRQLPAAITGLNRTIHRDSFDDLHPVSKAALLSQERMLDFQTKREAYINALRSNLGSSKKPADKEKFETIRRLYLESIEQLNIQNVGNLPQQQQQQQQVPLPQSQQSIDYANEVRARILLLASGKRPQPQQLQQPRVQQQPKLQYPPQPQNPQLQKQKLPQPLTTIPFKQRLAVELTAPRSGSTFLVNVFSVISNAFVLPEPYNMFDVNITLPSFMDRHARPPSITSLLDCSFVNSPGLNQIFWSYACENIQWVKSNSTLLAQCWRGKLPASTIRDHCKKSSLNLIKIVRMPFVVENFGPKNAIPSNVKVFNLVRAPWDIFMSQFQAGWFRNNAYSFVAKRPPGMDIFEYNMDRICNHLLLNRNVTLDRPIENQFFIRYEDLVADFNLWVGKLFEFLDIPVTNSTLFATKQIKEHVFVKSMGVLVPNEAEKQMTVEKAKALAETNAPCRTIMSLFNYN